VKDDKSVVGSVAIPLLRSTITGLLCALSIVTAYDLYSAVTGWRLFWFVAAAVSLAAWVLGAQQREHTSEVRTYSDTTKVEVIATDPTGAFKSGVWADFPVGRGVMVGAASYYMKTHRFSHAMSGHGKPFTRGEYEAVRDEMIARGLAYWVRPGYSNQGVALTRAGEAFMKRLAGAGAAHAHTSTQGVFDG
jgi:hypothetical protein